MCLDDQMLSCYIDGELEEPWKSQVEEHIEWCDSCKKRLKELKLLQNNVREAVLSDDSIESSKDRVFTFINKNILNKKKTSIKQKVFDFFKRKLAIPTLSVCVTFCVCLIIFNQDKPSEIMKPVVPPLVNVDSIIPVRATDNYSSSKSLENYTLDEIIHYLDSCGYNVSISLKGIEPIDTIYNIEYSEGIN